MLIHLFSYRNIFLDGETKLHPGFTHKGRLYALTTRRPEDTPYIEVPADAIHGEHFKPRATMYVTIAYNPDAKRYNNKSGGTIDLTKIDLSPLLKLNIVKLWGNPV